MNCRCFVTPRVDISMTLRKKVGKSWFSNLWLIASFIFNFLAEVNLVEEFGHILEIAASLNFLRQRIFRQKYHILSSTSPYAKSGSKIFFGDFIFGWVYAECFCKRKEFLAWQSIAKYFISFFLFKKIYYILSKSVLTIITIKILIF